MWVVLHVLLGRNFVSDLPTLKPKKPKNLKTYFFFKKPRFLPALRTTRLVMGSLLWLKTMYRVLLALSWVLKLLHCGYVFIGARRNGPCERGRGNLVPRPFLVKRLCALVLVTQQNALCENYLCIIFTTCRRLLGISPRTPPGLHLWTPLGDFGLQTLNFPCGRPFAWFCADVRANDKATMQFTTVNSVQIYQLAERNIVRDGWEGGGWAKT